MTINFSKNNPYNDFIQVPKITAPVQTAAPFPPTASVKVGEVEEQDESKGKKKIFGIIGVSVGSVALLTLIGLFTLSKGFASGFANKINTYSRNLQSKINDLSSSAKELTASQKMKLRVSKAIQPVADTMQAASNITAVKDSWCHHWMRKLNLEPVVKKINSFFKLVVTKTTKNSYMNAETSNLKFCSYIDDLAAKTKDPAAKQKLETFAGEMRKQFGGNFTFSHYFNRSENAYKKMEGLDKEVYDILFTKDGGVIKNAKKLGSYVTTDLIAKDRAVLTEKLLASKSKLSNNVTDNYNNIKQLLGEIESNVITKDDKALDIMKRLSESLAEYKKAGGANEKQVRDKLCASLKNDMGKLFDVLKSDKQYASKIPDVKSKVAAFYNAVDPNIAKKGLAQDAITLIKEQYGKNSPEYIAAKKYMHNLNIDLNKAIASELNAYEKLAELQVGSAPTDILGILGPSALATLMVVNSKDKNERISKTLTSGVPILGGIGMSYYGTTRGFTGAKNLILGLTTGYLLNVFGSKADEWYKKHIEQQNVLKNAFTALAKLQGKQVPELK